MRPKKTLLLFCDTIAQHEEMIFLLRLNRYNVYTLETIGSNRKPDAVLVMQSLHGSKDDTYIRSAVEIIRKTFDTPVILVNHDGVTNADVDMTFSAKSSTAEWLHQVRIMSARRRGPKKQPVLRESVAA